jgi:acyl carrier protein
MPKSVRSVIKHTFKSELKKQNTDVNESISDDMVLLESGLDSIGFAILVAKLEEELGYDPFVLMDDPVYPSTFGEFVEIYEKYSHHRS